MTLVPVLTDPVPAAPASAATSTDLAAVITTALPAPPPGLNLFAASSGRLSAPPVPSSHPPRPEPPPHPIGDMRERRGCSAPSSWGWRAATHGGCCKRFSTVDYRATSAVLPSVDATVLATRCLSRPTLEGLALCATRGRDRATVQRVRIFRPFRVGLCIYLLVYFLFSPRLSTLSRE